MSILVTGCAGFIGSHFCERLLGASEEVVGLDVFDDFYAPTLKEANLAAARQFDSFTLVRADVRDAESLRRLPDHVDLVVHLAARAGVRPSIADPLLYEDVNVRGTAVLLEFMRKRGILRLIFGSSSSVYGNQEQTPFRETDSVDLPISPYAATKKAGELLCHTYHHLYGLNVLCLRLFTVYGPRQRPDLAIHKFARLLRAGKAVPMYGDGTTERDYTYIDDILQGLEGAQRYLRANAECYEIVNLGESHTVSLRRMIRVLGEALGVEPTAEILPIQPGDVTRTYADITKARRLWRYDPRTDFEAGIARFVEWFETQSPGRGTLAVPQTVERAPERP